MSFVLSTHLWISLLQIQIGATVVAIAAGCIAPLIKRHQIVAREWLWHGALIGVLASLLIPFLNRIAPDGGPELAIVPASTLVTTPPTTGNQKESATDRSQQWSPSGRSAPNLTDFQNQTSTALENPINALSPVVGLHAPIQSKAKTGHAGRTCAAPAYSQLPCSRGL